MRAALVVALLMFGVTSPCYATIVAAIMGAEKGSIIGTIDDAEQKIDVRCIAIEEPEIVKALKRASERGVSVRIVIDVVSKELRKAVCTGNSNLEVRALSHEYHGLFLIPSILQEDERRGLGLSESAQKKISARTRRYLRGNTPEATIEVDRIRRWQGVTRLSSRQWVNISTEIIHTLYPDPIGGTARFLAAWQRSKTIDSE